MTYIVKGSGLAIEDVVNVARFGYSVELTADAVKRVERARKTVDDFVAAETRDPTSGKGLATYGSKLR